MNTKILADKRVLIVEDDGPINMLLEMYLTQQGFKNIDTALTYVETINQIINHTYDLILLDCNLGGKSTGLDVLIKYTKYITTAFIIATSSSKSYREIMVQSGASLGICKGDIMHFDFTNLWDKDYDNR